MENFNFYEAKEIGYVENLDEAVDQFEEKFGDLASSDYNVLPNVKYVREIIIKTKQFSILTNKWIIVFELPCEIWDDLESKNLACCYGCNATYDEFVKVSKSL